MAMLVKRAWPPLGGSSVMRTTALAADDTLAHAERLVEAMALDGYSEVEFRRGRDGAPRLMEVNPRLSQSAELAIRAGVDFPRMQLEWARGGDVTPVDGYRTGVKLAWLGGDARLTLAALRGSGPPPRPRQPPLLRDYVLRRTRIEGLDLDDLRPVVSAVAFTARAVRRRGTPRLSG
jgi:hypothetical protein